MHPGHLKPVSVYTIAPLVGVLTMLFALSASGADHADAQALIEQHCSSCHGSEMYTREDRKVNSFSALSKQVAACNSNLNTGLSQDEVGAVAALLNEQYYNFAE
jgi:mono/diheme cytochrome c family protein